jgi:uncharacterized protein YuzE
MTSMRMTYDPAANAAYLYLAPDGDEFRSARTYACDPVEVGGMINLDFDSNGRLIGLEVLGARSKLTEHLLSDAELIGRPAGDNSAPQGP